MNIIIDTKALLPNVQGKTRVVYVRQYTCKWTAKISYVSTVLPPKSNTCRSGKFCSLKEVVVRRKLIHS